MNTVSDKQSGTIEVLKMLSDKELLELKEILEDLDNYLSIS